MAETQASVPPYDRDIEIGAPPPYMGEMGAPPPYEEATSRPSLYIPNEPVTRLAIDDLLVSFQSESVSRVDEVSATISQEEEEDSCRINSITILNPEKSFQNKIGL
uniref:Uncharacterized protein n=1 Tax=Acrobeloides nanus TaxID=290746 RepID=A0A914DSK9_9BILA